MSTIPVTIGSVVVVSQQLVREHGLPNSAGVVIGQRPSGWSVEWLVAGKPRLAIVPETNLTVCLPNAEAANAAVPTAPSTAPSTGVVPAQAAVATPAKAPAPTPAPCGCGCGDPVVNPKARFLSGHDARLDSFCRKLAIGKATSDEESRVARADALGLLLRRGCGHLALFEHHPCSCEIVRLPKKVRVPSVPGEPKANVADLQKQLADLQKLVLKLTAASSHPDIVDEAELMAALDEAEEQAEEQAE